ncbi:hypothetical protein ISN44_Un23g000020 [Arabidopsis suecica]|uniref:Uncharacterized protein n=1 Tax=Arabidopsis suecica TaxID=45249 RepID=A0A8T1XCK2_ARASU|nr:hypothetical protein ISN44_Un23g000020 [Arabidopsis suecica]
MDMGLVEYGLGPRLWSPSDHAVYNRCEVVLKLTPPSCKKASPAPIRTMKVRGNENWSKKSSISTREATPAPIRTMKVRANENWSEISTRKASPAPIRTMKVRGNENWYEKSSISTSNRQPAPIRTMKVRGIENCLGRPRVPPYSVPDVGSDRGILSGGMTDRLSDRPTAGNYRRKIFPATFPAIGFVAVFEFFQQFSDKNCCVVAENGRVMRGMTLDSSRPWGGGRGWRYIRNAPEIPRCPHGHRFHPPRLDGRASLESMDPPRLSRVGARCECRPWASTPCGFELKRRYAQVVTSCGFLGVTSSLPFADVLGNHLLMGSGISAGSDTRLPVSCVSFALRLRYSQPRLDGRAKAWIRLGCLDGFFALVRLWLGFVRLLSSQPNISEESGND